MLLYGEANLPVSEAEHFLYPALTKAYEIFTDAGNTERKEAPCLEGETYDEDGEIEVGWSVR
jgi:hypothetical protein